MARETRFPVNPTRMKRKLRALGERASLHPDPAVRRALRGVIEVIDNKHVRR